MMPLHVVCFSDGRPGHEKQSRAVLFELQKRTPVRVSDVILPRTSGAGRLVQGLRSLLRPFKVAGRDEGQGIDLIIGTGSSTHLPMVGMKWRSGAKAVTCMSPDPWVRPWIDLCFVPRHDQPPQRDSYLATFGPPCLALDERRQDPDKGLILVGGVDVKSHHWDTTELMSQIATLMSTSPDLQWTVSSSPRTPSDTLDRLRHLMESTERVEFFTAQETPRGWIEAAYAEHSQVWVTADSVSMVYEALTAGCRVGILPVQWRSESNKFQDGIDDLMQHGMVVDLAQWKDHPVFQNTPQSLNEAERCAREILKRWWPDRLP